MKQRLTALLAALVLVLCLPMTVSAHEVPDLTRTGSIEVLMRIGTKAVSGGTLTATKVGYIDKDDGDYFFRRLDGERLTDITSSTAPGKLKDFADNYGKNHPMTSLTVNINKEGKAKFGNLKPGLYLITQKKAASGYNPLAPFLVSVPYNDDGHYEYNVDINSKAELEKTPEKPHRPGKPSEKLPQTGQLNWPVPVLAGGGLLLMIVGYLLLREKKHLVT